MTKRTYLLLVVLPISLLLYVLQFPMKKVQLHKEEVHVRDDDDHDDHDDTSTSANVVFTDDANETCAPRNITIVAWNGYWHWSDFGIGIGNRGFVQHKCGCTNCYLSTDKQLAKSADGILFHGHQMQDIPLQKLTYLRGIRNHDGLPAFIYFNRESPKAGQPLLHKVYDSFFNLTMTYRTDSDIPNLYGKLVPTSKRAKIAAQNGSWLQYDPEKRPPNVSPNEERTQDIAWMVSHCQTNSHREKVVNKLRQATNLTIDIYGKCGDREHRLKPETSDQIETTLHNRAKMYQKVLRKYKFYLSFENALCQDYITEKLFLAVFAGALPIVYGGKTREDYNKVAPPHSFIHVEDFASIEELAKHINHLAVDEEAYSSYFWWRDDYKVLTLFESQWAAFCGMCHKLNAAVIASEESTASVQLTQNNYKVFHKYWNEDNICSKAKDRYL